MSTEISTDAVLGNQGSSEFGSILTGSNSQPTSAPNGDAGSSSTSNVRGDVAGSLPKKDASQIPDGGVQQTQQTQQTQTQQNQQAAVASPGQTQTQSQPNTQQVINQLADGIVQAQLRAERQQQQQQAAQPKQLSAEEFAQKYKVARANENLVATILAGDPKAAAAALNEYGQNLVQQAILMTLDLSDANLKKFQDEVNPHVTSWQQHQQQLREQQAEKRFFDTYSDLANERDLVFEMKDAVIAKINAGQLRFANEQEAFSAVANACRKILQRQGVTPGTGAVSVGTGTPQAPTGQQQTRQMSAASSAGRTGTGQATAKTDGEQIFGNDWK